MNLQATYRENIFSSVEEMDTAVQAHIYHNATDLSDNYKKILRLLANYALKTLGTAHLKYDTIAEQIGCSKSTIVRAIKRLKDLGIIEVTKGKKRNGIQGADYFHILNFNKQVTMRMTTREMTTRATHEKPRSSKAQDTKNHTESFYSFKSISNPFVVNNVNTYSACDTAPDLKSQLRAIYNPQSVEGNQAFEELSKIAFGRIKQYMKSHNMPYLQMEQIVLNCMRALVNKQGVRNQFAMYSKMIERQVFQLFERHIEPQTSLNNGRNEKIPDWFYKRNEPSTVSNNDVDFEAGRRETLAKLAKIGVIV